MPSHGALMLRDILIELQESVSNSKFNDKFRRIDQLTFMQRIELLKALTTPTVVDLFRGKANNISAKKLRSMHTNYIKCIKSLCTQLDSIGFDIISHEVKYDELKIIYDGFVNLKYSSDEQLREIERTSFTNESLRGAVEYIEAAELAYNESRAASYDPIRPKVLAGLTESLVKANLQDLHSMQHGETKKMQRNMFPYSPDVLMGFEGRKLGIFVLNDDSVMRDTDEPCGFTKGKMKLVE